MVSEFELNCMHAGRKTAGEVTIRRRSNIRPERGPALGSVPLMVQGGLAGGWVATGIDSVLGSFVNEEGREVQGDREGPCWGEIVAWRELARGTRSGKGV